MLNECEHFHRTDSCTPEIADQLEIFDGEKTSWESTGEFTTGQCHALDTICLVTKTWAYKTCLADKKPDCSRFTQT